MKNVTITEIRETLKKQGAELNKLRMQLNGNAAYKIEYSDGGFNLFTVTELKTAYANGAL